MTCRAREAGGSCHRGRRLRNRLRHPTRRESQPCGLRTLEGAHYAGRAAASPDATRPTARAALVNNPVRSRRRSGKGISTGAAGTSGATELRVQGFGEPVAQEVPGENEEEDGEPGDQREVGRRPEILARFKQELILARQITHRNVIRIFDLGTSGDMGAALWTEFLSRVLISIASRTTSA